ncbi:MAG: hypothetical protein WCL08_07470 [Verrucomicrobiota bacterium]
MLSLLIKNIPPELHARLKQRALDNRRSLNEEILSIMELAAPAEAVVKSVEEMEPSLSEDQLDAYPVDVAAKLRAFRDLGRGMAARSIDFEQWKRSAADSRR